jgi:hypothetical protein
LEYQLEERIDLVAPPNPLVGDLLTDLGNINALERSTEFAIPVYDLALRYGTPRDKITRLRKDHFAALVAANPLSGQPSREVGYTMAPFALIVVVLFAAFVLVVWVLRKRSQAASAAHDVHLHSPR